MQDGNRIDDVVDAAFALMPGGQAFKHLTGSYFETPDRRLARAHGRLEFEWLLDDVAEIKERVKRLCEERKPEEQPTAADIGSLLEAANRVSRKTADDRKRRLLRRAVLNAFDSDLYEQGLNLRLLRILEDLEYGDVVLLKDLAEDKKSSNVSDWLKGGGKIWAEKIEDHHLRNLVDPGLVFASVPPQDRAWATGRFQARATELGKLLLTMLREPVRMLGGDN